MDGSNNSSLPWLPRSPVGCSYAEPATDSATWQTFGETVLHALGDGLCVLDAEGRLLLMNPQAEALLGWREAELLGHELLAIIDDPDRPIEEQVSLQALVGAGETFHKHDGNLVRRDGSRLPVFYTVTPVAAAGQFRGAVLLFRDMTPRQRRLAAQAQVIRRESLLRLAQRMAAQADPEQVLTELLSEAVAVVGGQDGLLTRWDAQREVLVSVRNSMPLDGRHVAIEIGHGVSGRAIASGAAVWLNDYQVACPDSPAAHLGVQAAVAVPLINEGRPLGALSVNTYDPNKKFTSDDADCLGLLAGVASGVLASLDRAAQLAAANSELTQARDDAQYRAMHDSLTGLPNRTLMANRLEQGILAADRNGTALALLVMDLDRFKYVNDTLGHPCGDDLLHKVGARFQGALRASDTVARLGGDEFAVILPITTDAALPTQLAAKLIRALELPFMICGQSVSIGASVGVAVYPEHGSDAQTLMRHADSAMYVAKRSGGGTAVYSAERDATPDRITTVGELRRAIESDQLVLHYQPTVSLDTGQCPRVEALVRWQHPQRGLVPPDQFIPLAEETGLIKPLTGWVLRTAMRQRSAWQQSGLELVVAVNLSMRNLHDPELVDEVSGLLSEFDLEPAALKVEVTESTLMTDSKRALESLARLQAIGLEVAIDDFGTGHSSLSYLKYMPVAEIKLDRSFVSDMCKDKKDYMIVRSTIELAHNLGLRVVAEGVEDQATWDALAELGCDFAQGYHMSRPLTDGELRRWLGGRAGAPDLSRAA
jgi:diguanylate cyclase (GGDEF)-like protein/PAS domain S-box-containing protein